MFWNMNTMPNMKTNVGRTRGIWIRVLLLAATCVLARATAHADQPTVAVSGLPADQDTSIVIHKGPNGGALEPPDYRIDSGSEEIAGEPVAGQAESYASWKQACADWKKDMREMNGKTLISLACGTPHSTRDSATSRVTQTSEGLYKIKIRVRDTQAMPAAPNAAVGH